MEPQNFSFETDADGVALLTFDMPGRSMYVFTFAVMAGPGGCHVEVGVPVTHSAVLDGLSARAAYLAGLDT